MTDAYGLAYMTAKNIIGPTSIAAIYAALKYGVDFSSGAFAWFGGSAAGGATAAAGKTAGALALASWISTLFFPLVVLGAGFLGTHSAEILLRRLLCLVSAAKHGGSFKIAKTFEELPADDAISEIPDEMLNEVYTHITLEEKLEGYRNKQ